MNQYIGWALVWNMVIHMVISVFIALNWRFLQMEQPPRPTMFDFHGICMTKYFTSNWDDVQNFKARPDDILIATYPKAGGLF